MLISLLFHGGAVTYVVHSGMPVPLLSDPQAVSPGDNRRIHLDAVRPEPAAAEPATPRLTAARAMADRVLSAPMLDRMAGSAPAELQPRVVEPKLAPSIREPPSLAALPADIAMAAGSRQELIAIDKVLARDSVPYLERRLIPKLERIDGAADVALPVASPEAGPADAVPLAPVQVDPGRVSWRLPGPAALNGDGLPGLPGGDVAMPDPFGSLRQAVEEKPEAISEHKAVETLLKARMTVYRPLLDANTYFRIAIERIGPELLPVLPHDVLLVQDASASMTEQRLSFCRQGLTNALLRLRDGNRFNVVQFKDSATPCFADWQPVTAESRQQGIAFVQGMRSGDATDIYTSIRALLRLRREPGRPVIMLLVTDGRSTTGVTESSDIIGQFTRDNQGAVSVFTFGTIGSANRYLLDMLSYCNRGDSHVVEEGRWSIPGDMVARLETLARPCLTELGFSFADPDRVMAYPVMPENLYLDRPLVLYGRCPRRTENVVFQVVGRAGARTCDMVFDLKLAEADQGGDGTLRAEWGRQRAFFLAGEFARTRDPATRREMEQTVRSFDVPIPRDSR